MITNLDQLNNIVRELVGAKERLALLTTAQRRDLVSQCLTSVYAVGEEWAEAACQAKGPPSSPVIAAEELVNGPTVTLRYLQLIRAALDDLSRGEPPRLPGPIATDDDGRVLVPVFPAKGLFDRLSFLGFSAYARMLPEVTRDNLNAYRAPLYDEPAKPVVSLVLGAGNVSSIPLVDVLSKLFHERHVVLLKMNPVNEYLGPIFERAMAPLIASGFVRIIYGGPEVGAAAIAHPDVANVHVTGSINTHDAIVWGPPGEERERRKREDAPLLQKPITSELGNVSPWIVIPGKYSDRQLAFQAENIAASITNNASFNCVATKLIVTSRKWADRSRFLDLLEGCLSQTPARKPYYPGAVDRYRRFACDDLRGPPEIQSLEGGVLPWKLHRNIDPDRSPHFLTEESFVCVSAEMSIDSESPEDFVERAVAFVNDRVWGTLCAALTVPPDFDRTTAGRAALGRAIRELRYGTVCINHWPALVYALMTPPWGGYPGSSRTDAQSGVGWVHNTYMLHGVEKTVLRGPLTVFPKPLWFPTHRHPERVAKRMMQLYSRPTWSRWAKLLSSSLSPI